MTIDKKSDDLFMAQLSMQVYTIVSIHNIVTVDLVHFFSPLKTLFIHDVNSTCMKSRNVIIAQ